MFTGAKVIKLEQNYRSTQTILNAANAVISNNIGRKSKSPGLITERARRSIILCMRTDMMRQKALRVVLQSM